MYVLADIGGTNIRFAAVNELGSEPTASQRMSFKTSDFPSLALALSVFLKHMHIIPSSVTSCICAVPGHVVNNTASTLSPISHIISNRGGEHISLGYYRRIKY